MRASSYNIFVELPGNPERVLLVHGYTGAYDLVSKSVASFVQSLQICKTHEPLFGTWSPAPGFDETSEPPSLLSLDRLRKRGYLTDMTPAEEESYFHHVATRLHEISRRQIRYVMMPTYDCNLRCGYCYQDHFRTDSRFAHLLQIMTIDVVDRIFAAMPRIEKMHDVSATPEYSRDITFYGGEPLTERSLPIVEYIIEKSAEIGSASFSAVTNGTELAAYRHILAPNKISSLQFTLDGPPGIHDTRRVYPSGAGSFECIAKNIQLALDLGVQVLVRVNVDRSNIEFLPELAREIVSRGWIQHDEFFAYAAPITVSTPKSRNQPTSACDTCGIGAKSSTSEASMSTWQLDNAIATLQEKHEVVRVISRWDERLESTVGGILQGLSDPLSTLTSSFCSAHRGMYLFDPFCDIYACWERTGDPKHRIGTLDAEGNVSLSDSGRIWRRRQVSDHPVCRRCRFALYCGGGCAVRADEAGRGLAGNYCDGFAARFKSSAAKAFADFSRSSEASPP